MLAILVIVFIIILLEIIIIGFTFSNIIIDINDFDISYNEVMPKEFKVNKIDIVVKIYIFKVFKVLSIKIHRNYFEVFKIKFKLNILKKVRKDYDRFYRNFEIMIKKRDEINFKLLRPRINSLDLELFFGTYSPLLTTFSIPAISTFLSVFLSNSITNYDVNTYNYKIVPRYLNRNCLSIELKTELSFNSINLILFLWSVRKILRVNQ